MSERDIIEKFIIAIRNLEISIIQAKKETKDPKDINELNGCLEIVEINKGYVSLLIDALNTKDHKEIHRIVNILIHSSSIIRNTATDMKNRAVNPTLIKNIPENLIN